METSLDAIVIVSQKTGRITASNSMTSVLFGHEIGQVVGQPLSLLMGGMLWVESGPNTNCFSGEGVHRNGRSMSLLFATTTVVWEGEVSLLATIKDVTEVSLHGNMPIKRDNGVDMICCYNADLKITFANQTFARFYGVRRQTLLDIDIRTLMGREEREEFDITIGQLTPLNPTIRSHIEIERGGVETFQDWIEHVTYNNDGSVKEYQRVGRDIADALKIALAKAR